MACPRTTAELRAQGYGSDDLTRLVERRELVRVRRGAYVEPPTAPLSAEARHRQLVAATLPLVAGDAVVSHRSAAVLHGLPLLDPPPEQVELTRSTARGGKNRSLLHLYAAPLPPDEVTEIEGLPVTSLARTVVDLGRSLPFDAAVVTGDPALHAGLDPGLLEASLALAAFRPGVAAARRAVRFLDGLSESPGESLSRVGMARDGIPKPKLQLRVPVEPGRLVARCDFGWPKYKTVGEFDGKVKYEKLLRPGETMRDVVWREKKREDALRDLGWQVVRWLWADLYRPGVVAERLQRAFARASR